MRFLTIATSSYSIYANRLIRSLLCAHPDAQIVIYTDRNGHDKFADNSNVVIRVLDKIDGYGVKRAKFLAYADMARDGGFVYLDSDILILKPLDDLLFVESFTACRDDLRECPFITDPEYPWKNAPELSGKHYFNSGVFAVPAGYADFFEAIKEEAADDAEWRRFTIEGKLYDNHFLCAKVAQHKLPIEFISELEYNWQGYRSFQQLDCYLDDKENLRNRTSGKFLRLVHFAGIKDIDAHIVGLPAEIAGVLAKSMGVSDCGVLELISGALNTQRGIEPRLKIVLSQSMCKVHGDAPLAPGAEATLLEHQDSVSSILFSVQEADFLWNDLKCGSAYLSAAEYLRLRSFISAADVNAVLEFGAGYTTVLFAKLGCKQIAIEGWDGPWLDYARSQGADARHVTFSSGIGFEENDLAACRDQIFSSNGKKMVFIDSPPGTANRLCVADQVIRLTSGADFYVIHDANRDSSIVYRLCMALGLQVVDHLGSIRGLTFLGRPGAYAVRPPLPQRELKERVAHMRFEVRCGESVFAKDGIVQSLFIHLINTGVETISTDSDNLAFSLHVLDGSGEVLYWDTPRYQLPVDLFAGDRVSFKIDVREFTGQAVKLIFDFVKEGEFWWSNVAASPCPEISLL